MSPDRLVYMANQIGKFFEVQRADEVVPGIANHIRKFWDPRMREAIFAYNELSATRQRSRAGIANHIKKFWTPRMRKAIFAYMDAGGEGIDPPVREALDQLQAELAEGKSSLGEQSSFQGT